MKKKFRKVRKYMEFVPNKDGKDWFVIICLAIPLIGTLLILSYILLGHEETYYEEMKK